jgi:small membrane protein
MTAIQILLVCFALFAFSRALLRFRRGDLPLFHLVLWFVFWAGVVVVALRPETTSALASLLGVGRGADVVLYLALALLFYLVFRMFGKIEDLERQITRVVRAAALEKLDGPGSPGGGSGLRRLVPPPPLPPPPPRPPPLRPPTPVAGAPAAPVPATPSGPTGSGPTRK